MQNGCLRGVLFDMDGVLLDSERPHIEIDIQLAAEMGHTLPDTLIPELFGSTEGRIRAMVCEQMGGGFDCDYFLDESRRRAAAWLEASGAPLMKGALPLLQALHARGVPCAVASSSQTAAVHESLRRAGVLAYFAAFVGGDEVARSKPAPDIFLVAAERLGLPAGACLAVEDSYAGVRSAAAAGCVTVMVPDVLPATAEMRALAAAVLSTLDDVLPFWVARGGA